MEKPINQPPNASLSRIHSPPATDIGLYWWDVDPNKIEAQICSSNDNM